MYIFVDMVIVRDILLIVAKNSYRPDRRFH